MRHYRRSYVLRALWGNAGFSAQRAAARHWGAHASRQAGMCCGVALAVWLLAFFEPAIHGRVWAFFSATLGPMALPGVPALSAALGAASLALVKLRGAWARRIVPAMVVTYLPLCFIGTALPIPFLPYLALAFLVGVTLLSLDARWQALAERGAAARCRTEKWLLCCMPALLLAYRSTGWESSALQPLDGLGMVLSTYLCHFTYASYSAMGKFMAGIAPPNGDQGNQRALVLMAAILLWPVWIVDRLGFVVTGRTLD